jgi:glycosyltransferase involved in cell wall biosynthesis
MKLHIISSSLRINSGFSIVARNLAIGLKKLGWNVTYSGLQTAYSSEYGYGIEVLPTQVGFVDDITQTMITIGRVKPDIVLAIIQMDADFNEFAKLFSKTVVYPPVEGKNIPPKMVNDLLSIKMNGGLVIAQCKYGKSEIELALASLTVPYIYHGFDPEVFYPIADVGRAGNYCYYRTEIGKINTDPFELYEMECFNCRIEDCSGCEYYKEEIVSLLRFINGKWTEETVGMTDLYNLTKGKFVFGFVGQNLGVRKRIERLLKAYSIFIGQSKQLRDRTILHLHCMPMSIGGVDLIHIIQNLGLQNNVIFSFGTYRSSGWSDQAMNILYNSFDVNVSASSSEGFGLATIESMACGIPNIGPDCSSFTELIGHDEDESKNRGYLVDIGEWQMIQDSSYRALVNESDFALRMRDMYELKGLREVFSKNAIGWSKNYTWDKMTLKWDELLKKMK